MTDLDHLFKGWLWDNPETRADLRQTRPADRALLSFAFRDRPLFRLSRHDAHIRQWERHMRQRVWRAYWNRPEFAAAYDAVVQARSSAPLPPMAPAPDADSGLISVGGE